jgi:enamidase
MRAFPVLCFALAFAGTCTAAAAQDDDDAPPPSIQTQSDDAKFIAYSQPVIALTHAEIVDGTGAAPKFDQTLVVANGHVSATGPFASVAVPPGATAIDAHGETLMPGFVMAHEHLFYPMGHGNYARTLRLSWAIPLPIRQPSSICRSYSKPASVIARMRSSNP